MRALSLLVIAAFASHGGVLCFAVFPLSNNQGSHQGNANKQLRKEHSLGQIPELQESARVPSNHIIRPTTTGDFHNVGKSGPSATQLKGAVSDEDAVSGEVNNNEVNLQRSAGQETPNGSKDVNGGIGIVQPKKEANEHLGRWPCLDELDRKMIKIAVPCIANFAIGPLIGAVDLFWVGRMGNALALAGQAAANSVFNSIFWLASFMPSVTATLVSKVYAEGDEDAVQDVVCQALLVGWLISVLGASFILLQPEKVLSTVLAVDSPAMEFAKPYIMIRALAFLPSLISVIGYAAFRGTLDTVSPLRISLFANVFNAVLDPIFIFRLGMGVGGAALATVAAEVISAVAFMRTLLKRNMIRWSKLFKLPSWASLEPLLRGGAALQLRNLAINITFLAVARATQSIDNTGVAASAHSIAIQVFQVGGIFLLALSTVAQTLIPNTMVVTTDEETGSKSGGMLAAKMTNNRLMSWGLVLGTVLGALQILLLPLIHKISPLEEVQKAARVPSYIASLLQIINGWVFIGEGVMVGCSNFLQLSLSTVVATAATTVALRILPYKYGLTGVWMSFGVFNGLRLVGVWLHQTRTGPLAWRNLRKNEELGIAAS